MSRTDRNDHDLVTAGEEHHDGAPDMARSGRHRAGRATVGIVGAVVAAAVVAALTLLPTTSADSATSSAAVSQLASPKQIEQYCPAQMNLADTGSYGDSEFQATTGDIASRTRYVALGSVFHAQVEALSDVDGANATVLSGPTTSTATSDTEESSSSDDDTAVVASADSQKEATVLDTRILTADDGTGAAGTLFSWATTGDIEGVSAAGCTTTALTQTLLVPETSSSTTEQLVITNPGDRATTVDIEIHGPDGDVAMATNSTIAIAAASSATVDLAAAAGDQSGLYVKLTSSVTPVGAVVRSIAMDGLTPNGSDFAVPLASKATGDSAAVQAIPLGSYDSSSESLTTYLYADVDTDVTLKWTGTAGAETAKTVQLAAGKVSVVTLDDAPGWTTGLVATTEDASTGTSTGDDFSILAKVSKSGDGGQRDFALVAGSAAAGESAVAVPSDAQASVVLVNPTSEAATVTLQPVKADGTFGTAKSETIDHESGLSVAVSDLGDDVAAVRVTTDASGDDSSATTSADDDNNNPATVVWGLGLSSKSVSGAGLAGLAYVASTPLTVSKTTVNAINDPTIVK
ncbi:DUF5719 family protein [Bifidobacterium choloepi]|uniref:DUF5719 family protein n=1 Tax=Bifidobacterium choloepi TaxID=2614131 RepID=UPI0013D615AE|nr:DUF5719 family protein [Bifidobacterium choloepi]